MNVVGNTPNFGQMGTEHLPSGNGAAQPYGLANSTTAAPMMTTNSMQGPQDSAIANIGYRPESGRADRLGANIVGSSGAGNF